MRRVLIAFAVGGALLMAGSVAPAVNPPASQGGDARLRLAIVLADPAPTADTLYVQIQGGTEVFPLPYPAGYVPLAGDQVQVLSIGSGATETAMVIAPVAGRSGNRVLNGAFTVVGDAQFATPPAHWTHYRASGPVAITVTGTPFSGFEDPVIVMGGNTALASDNYVYSAAMPVTPGEVYEFSAVGEIDFADPNITVSLVALWFGSTTATYPGETVTGDTTVATSTIDESIQPEYFQSGNVTVPVGVSVMRMALRVQQGAGAGSGYFMQWLSASAYRI